MQRSHPHSNTVTPTTFAIIVITAIVNHCTTIFTHELCWEFNGLSLHSTVDSEEKPELPKQEIAKVRTYVAGMLSQTNATLTFGGSV